LGFALDMNVFYLAEPSHFLAVEVCWEFIYPIQAFSFLEHLLLFWLKKH
jgi:hypothetical protein